MPTDYGLLLGVSTGGGGVAGPFGNHATLGGKVIAHWKLDETSGPRADSHASNTLVDNNTVLYAAGKLNNAADFVPANSEYLSITDNPDVSFGDEDFGITGWVYFDSAASVIHILAKGTTDEYELSFRTTSVVRWYVENASGVSDTVDSATLSTATWYFFYVYHDASSNTIGISINNGAAVTAAHASGCRDSTGAFQIGARAAANYFDGRIDSVSLWNSLLTAGELTDLYNSGNGLDY